MGWCLAGVGDVEVAPEVEFERWGGGADESGADFDAGCEPEPVVVPFDDKSQLK